MDRQDLTYRFVQFLSDTFSVQDLSRASTRILMEHVAKRPHRTKNLCRMYGLILRERISDLTGPFIRHLGGHLGIEEEANYVAFGEGHSMKAEAIYAEISFLMGTDVAGDCIKRASWELPVGISQLDVNKRLGLPANGEDCSKGLSELKDCEVCISPCECNSRPLEHVLRQHNRFQYASIEQIQQWAEDRQMGVARLCTEYLGFLQKVTRYLIARCGMQCHDQESCCYRRGNMGHGFATIG